MEALPAAHNKFKGSKNKKLERHIYVFIRKVNLALWKKFNGFRPFLYNLTFEACSFIANPKSNPVANFVYESFMIYSNINHSCPITVSVIQNVIKIFTN